jgi:hypothetical protein
MSADSKWPLFYQNVGAAMEKAQNSCGLNSKQRGTLCLLLYLKLAFQVCAIRGGPGAWHVRTCLTILNDLYEHLQSEPCCLFLYLGWGPGQEVHYMTLGGNRRD